MITDHLKIRDYQILGQRPEAPGFWTQIDGCAQFLYKGLMVSMSTSGRSQGACMTHVCIYSGDTYEEVKKDGFSTVEEAIDWINSNCSIKDVYNNIVRKAQPSDNPFSYAFREYLFQKAVTPDQFSVCLNTYLGERPIINRDKVLAMLSKTDMSVEDFRFAMLIFNNIPE